MKKFLCLLWAAILLLGLTACGKANDKNAVKNQSSALKTVLTDGKLPEAEFPLGTDEASLTETLEQRQKEGGTDEEGEPLQAYFVYEKDDFRKITNGDFQEFEYYCKNGKVTAVVSNDAAFGFPKMTVLSEIKAAFADFTPIENDGIAPFFVHAGEICDCLTYQSGDRAVTFAFLQSGLVATAVYQTADWTVG